MTVSWSHAWHKKTPAKIKEETDSDIQCAADQRGPGVHQGHVHSLLRWPRPYRKRACWRPCPRNECVNGPESGGVCCVRQPVLCGEEEGRSLLSFSRRLVSSGGGGFHISGICLQEARRLSQRVRLGSELFFPCEVVTIFCKTTTSKTKRAGSSVGGEEEEERTRFS